MSRIKRITILFALILTSCSGSLPAIFPSPTPIPPTATPVPPTATPIPMAIIVNDEGISMDEMKAEVERYTATLAASGKTMPAEQVTQTVQDDFISQLLLAQGAAEAGFTLDADALQKRLDELAAKLGGMDKLTAWQKANGYTEENFNTALVRSASAAWMRDHIASSVPHSAQQVHARQILLYNEDVANSYFARLQQGEDFDQLADQVDPITRGDLGWFPMGYLAEKTVEDAAFALQTGATSEIIHSEVGFHIIKIMEIDPERELSPDALATLQTNAVYTWLQDRRQKSTITLTP